VIAAAPQSKQPKSFRALGRTDAHQFAERLACGVCRRPIRFRHRLFAVPVTGIRNEAPPRAPAARLCAIAPVAEQVALRPRDQPMLLPVRHAAPLAEGHPPRIFPVGGGHLSSHHMLPFVRASLRLPLPARRGEVKKKIENRSRDASAPECLPRTKPIQFPRMRGAERREAHPTNVRAAPADVAIDRCVRARKRAADKCTQSAQLICFRARSLPGAPQRHSPRQSQPALAQPQAVFPGTRLLRASPAARLSQSSALRADRSFCRTNGVQGRPGAGLRIPPAGAALAPPSVRHRRRPSNERDGLAHN